MSEFGGDTGAREAAEEKWPTTRAVERLLRELADESHDWLNRSPAMRNVAAPHLSPADAIVVAKAFSSLAASLARVEEERDEARAALEMACVELDHAQAESGGWVSSPNRDPSDAHELAAHFLAAASRSGAVADGVATLKEGSGPVRSGETT